MTTACAASSPPSTPNTGKLAWRFWTIPGPGEPGSESWPGNLYLRGGGTTWMPGTYDPELNTIYWGTSNPSPDFEGERAPRRRSLHRLRPRARSRYRQAEMVFPVHAARSFRLRRARKRRSWSMPTIKGQPRKLLVEANRNGFVYVLDRTNGKFLSATAVRQKLNWAKGIDANGRPIRTDVKPTAEGMLVCPGFEGATNWYSPAYNPETHLLYFLARRRLRNLPAQAPGISRKVKRSTPPAFKHPARRTRRKNSDRLRSV